MAIDVHAIAARPCPSPKHIMLQQMREIFRTSSCKSAQREETAKYAVDALPSLQDKKIQKTKHTPYVLTFLQIANLFHSS